MPATLVSVLDAETEVETVFYNYLATTLGITGVSKSDSATDQLTPRIGVVATLESDGWHQTTIASGTYAGRTLYDQKKVKLDVTLVYQPEQAQGQGSLRGTLRKALTDYTALQTAFATNGYYFLAPESLRQTAGGRTIDDPEKIETIATTLELELFICPAILLTAT